MSRALIFGLCPLPFENTIKSFGPGIRVWQFIQPLLKAGHEPALAAFRIPGTYPRTIDPIVFTDRWGFPYWSMDQQLFENRKHIEEIYRKFRPDVILACTIFSTKAPIMLQPKEPLWIDLFGHVMAEAQAKAYRYDDDSYLYHFWSYEREAICNGDVFSSVSESQRHATIGELGAMGRLNRLTTGYEFVYSIPCGVENSPYEHDRKVLRGLDVDEDDFVVLWSGGYNTWTDIDTLFQGIEIAMSRNPRIKFVSTGGMIDGHDEKTYPAFLKLIEASSYRERFIMKGWVPKQDVHNYYFESNVGINIDKFMYEGMFGSKNRVLDWMRAGLPALVGELCELSLMLESQEIGFKYPLGKPEMLAEKIIELSLNKDYVAQVGKQALQYAMEHLTFEKTVQPFLQWMEKAEPAPDRYVQINFVQPSMYSPNKNDECGTSNKAAASLRRELIQKKRQIDQIEHYVRHIENELRKRDRFSSKELLYLAAVKFKRRFQNVKCAQALPFSALPETPKVSVVIPHYNGASYIRGCLQSVQASGWANYEIIVVDDASEDESLTIIRNEFPTVKVMRNEKNMGFAASCNRGIREAGGRIIILLNQDTIVGPDFIEQMAKQLMLNPLTGIAGAKLYQEDGHTLQHAGGILHDNALTDHRGAGETDDGKYQEIADVDYVTGAAMGFRTELIERIGLLDEGYRPAYFEELDFCRRTVDEGFRVVFLPQAAAVHFESVVSGKLSKKFLNRYHKNRIRYVLKNYGLKEMATRFLKAEVKWLVKAKPKDHIPALLKAYIINLVLLPETFAARFSSGAWRR